MGGVQAKLSEAERDVDRVRKASMTARETFNAIRKERSVQVMSAVMGRSPLMTDR